MCLKTPLLLPIAILAMLAPARVVAQTFETYDKLLPADGAEVFVGGTLQNPGNLADAAFSEVPATYELSQNHSNPFNPQTKIRFGFRVSGWFR